MAGTLSGQVALVTGAGSPTGIGFATARLLLERGASVAISATTRRIEERARELGAGDRVFAAAADLTDVAAADGLAAKVIQRFGRLDILVNNAGMAQTGIDTPSKPLTEMEPELWRRMLAITLDTAYHKDEIIEGMQLLRTKVPATVYRTPQPPPADGTAP